MAAFFLRRGYERGHNVAPCHRLRGCWWGFGRLFPLNFGRNPTGFRTPGNNLGGNPSSGNLKKIAHFINGSLTFLLPPSNPWSLSDLGWTELIFRRCDLRKSRYDFRGNPTETVGRAGRRGVGWELVVGEIEEFRRRRWWWWWCFWWPPRNLNTQFLFC